MPNNNSGSGRLVCNAFFRGLFGEEPAPVSEPGSPPTAGYAHRLPQTRKDEFQLMEEVSEHRIEDYAKYFYGPQPGMVLASVAEGNTEAQLWYASQPDNNVVCLLWDKGNNVFYVSGHLVLSETIKDVASLINTHVKEKAVQEGLSYFKVKTLSSALENSITDIFQNIPLHKTNKLFYTFRAKKVKTIPDPKIEGIRYRSNRCRFS